MFTIGCRLTQRWHSLSWGWFLLVLLLSPLNASAANLTGLSLAPPNPTLNINETLQLIATGIFDDGTQLVMAQAKQVSAGVDHTCALDANGAVKCWGQNTSGQLGNGTTTDSSTPVYVSGINTAVAVSAGSRHTCAVLGDGRVQCWGGEFFGLSPLTISGINSAKTVSSGGSHSCATLADGTVRCWGRGILGDGLFTSGSTTPVTVSGISTAVTVSAGLGHTCAVLANGTVQCWGENLYGQVGNGATSQGAPTSDTVIGIISAVAVSAGSRHTCAVLGDGTVQCWGNSSSGQLGNGTNTYSSTPVTVTGLISAVAVSAGADHTCAVLVDTTVQCWGSNNSGQLGVGAISEALTPVKVSGISNVAAISTGGLAIISYNYNHGHTCALLSDHTIKCWGFNSSGQLGNGMTSAATAPVAVRNINTAVVVGAGSDHSCALLADGTVQCWGAILTASSATATPLVPLLRSLSAASTQPWPSVRAAAVTPAPCFPIAQCNVGGSIVPASSATARPLFPLLLSLSVALIQPWPSVRAAVTPAQCLPMAQCNVGGAIFTASSATSRLSTPRFRSPLAVLAPRWPSVRAAVTPVPCLPMAQCNVGGATFL